MEMEGKNVTSMGDTQENGNIVGSSPSRQEDEPSSPRLARKRRSSRVSLDPRPEKSKVMKMTRTLQEESTSSVQTHEPIPSTSQNGVHIESNEEPLEEWLRLSTVEDKYNTKVGFIGCGNLGFLIVKRMLNAGFKVYVWDITISKCKELVEAGAEIRYCASDIVSTCDVTFCCVSDREAVRNVVFGRYGVYKAMKEGKLFVDMSGVDLDTSLVIGNLMSYLGGRYLEVRVFGSYTEAENGHLFVYVSGDETDYSNCIQLFRSFGRKIKYMGRELGRAIRMNFLLELIHGVAIAGISDAYALARRLGLVESELMEFLAQSPFKSHLLLEKSLKFLAGDFFPDVPCSHLESQLKLAVEGGNEIGQTLHITTEAHNYFNEMKMKGHGSSDVCVIFSGCD